MKTVEEFSILDTLQNNGINYFDFSIQVHTSIKSYATIKTVNFSFSSTDLYHEIESIGIVLHFVFFTKLLCHEHI